MCRYKSLDYGTGSSRLLMGEKEAFSALHLAVKSGKRFMMAREKMMKVWLNKNILGHFISKRM